MQLNIKSLSGILDEEEKRIIRKKMLWFEGHLPNNSQMTVGVKQHITKKSNQAFEIIVYLNSPTIKKPVYVKVFKNKLPDALDIAKEKIERIVLKKKDKKQIKFKLPKINFRKNRDKIS